MWRGGGSCFDLYHLWTAAQGSYNKTHSYCLTLHPFRQTMSRRHPEFIYQLGYSLLKFPHNGCRMTRSAATGTFNISLCSINRGSSNKCWSVGLTLFQLGYVGTTPDRWCSRLIWVAYKIFVIKEMFLFIVLHLLFKKNNSLSVMNLASKKAN